MCISERDGQSGQPPAARGHPQCSLAEAPEQRQAVALLEDHLDGRLDGHRAQCSCWGHTHSRAVFKRTELMRVFKRSYRMADKQQQQCARSAATAAGRVAGGCSLATPRGARAVHSRCPLRLAGRVSR